MGFLAWMGFQIGNLTCTCGLHRRKRALEHGRVAYKHIYIYTQRLSKHSSCRCWYLHPLTAVSAVNLRAKQFTTAIQRWTDREKTARILARFRTHTHIFKYNRTSDWNIPCRLHFKWSLCLNYLRAKTKRNEINFSRSRKAASECNMQCENEISIRAKQTFVSFKYKKKKQQKNLKVAQQGIWIYDKEL